MGVLYDGSDEIGRTALHTYDGSGNPVRIVNASGYVPVAPSNGVYIPTLALRDSSAQSVTAYGTSTGPTAGTTIVTQAGLGAGSWQELTWTVMLTGTMTAAELSNFGIYKGATLLTTQVIPNIANTVATSVAPYLISASTTDTFTIKAIASAGASAVYSGNLNIRRMG